jgi:hypothetical protein
MPDPCLDITDLTTCRQHLMGTGSFDVASTDPADALIFGNITNGHFSGDRGVITLDVPLFVADQGLTLQMIGARSEVTVAADALTDGKLAGAVTETYIHDNVLPQLHNVLDVVVERDCHGTTGSCCDANTDGETVVNLFDSDGSCTVTLQELYDSGLLQSLLAPDVDLLDEEGLSGADGVLDSLSLGIGYTSVPATYPIPSGLP